MRHEYRTTHWRPLQDPSPPDDSGGWVLERVFDTSILEEFERPLSGLSYRQVAYKVGIWHRIEVGQ